MIRIKNETVSTQAGALFVIAVNVTLNLLAVAEILGYMVKNNIEDYSAGVPNDHDKIGAYKRGE